MTSKMLPCVMVISCWIFIWVLVLSQLFLASLLLLFLLMAQKFKLRQPEPVTEHWTRVGHSNTDNKTMLLRHLLFWGGTLRNNIDGLIYMREKFIFFYVKHRCLWVYKNTNFVSWYYNTYWIVNKKYVFLKSKRIKKKCLSLHFTINSKLKMFINFHKP